MSKELERIKKAIKPKDIYEQVAFDEDFETINNREKALEIIVKKNVHIDYLLGSCLEYYNDMVEIGEELTKKEYDFLRGVLM